jgi:hypothetical protein
MLKVEIREGATLGTEREGYYIFYQRGTIQLARVDYQLLRIVAFEGMCHVWTPQEFLGKEEGQTSASWLVSTLLQQLTNRNAIHELLLYLSTSQLHIYRQQRHRYIYK